MAGNQGRGPVPRPRQGLGEGATSARGYAEGERHKGGRRWGLVKGAAKEGNITVEKEGNAGVRQIEDPSEERAAEW